MHRIKKKSKNELKWNLYWIDWEVVIVKSKYNLWSRAVDLPSEFQLEACLAGTMNKVKHLVSKNKRRWDFLLFEWREFLLQLTGGVNILTVTVCDRNGSIFGKLSWKIHFLGLKELGYDGKSEVFFLRIMTHGNGCITF